MKAESFAATVTFNRAQRFLSGISGFATPPCLYEAAGLAVAVPTLLALTPWALAPFLILPLATGIHTIRSSLKLRKQEQCNVEFQRGHLFITIPGRSMLIVKPRKLTVIEPETMRISNRFTSITLETSRYAVERIKEQLASIGK